MLGVSVSVGTIMVHLTEVGLGLVLLSCLLGQVFSGPQNAAGPELENELYRGDKTRKTRLELTCGLCKLAVNTILNHYYRNNNISVAAEAAVNLCKSYKLSTDAVCEGTIRVHTGIFKFLADHNENGTLPQKLCSLEVGEDDCIFEDEWTVDVDLGTKPAVTVPEVQESESLTIVHISDIHYEQKYSVGSNAVCGEPVCCLQSQGKAVNESLAAGTWGDYRGCDVPINTMEDTLQFIKKQHQKIDYVYMTGDLVDHSAWVITREFNSEVITTVVNKLKKTFGNTPIIFSLGNHEAVPANCYAPLDVEDDSISTQWLFKLVSELWSPYITDEAKQTILKGGYYTLKIRDGFRVIVLNNNVHYSSNYWLAYKSEDPYNQLKWLAETLLQAEKNNEKVHLLYHIPSGYEYFLKTWSREFHKIVDRFENTITAHINGHTHSDEFQVFYSLANTSRVNNVALNGGSVTNFWDVNSNYKVYTVDPHSWYVIDAESWIFNLTDANLHPNNTPNWYKQYSFREAYGVKSIIPSEMESLVHHMVKDHSLLQKYNSFFYKDGDPSLAEGCNDDCLKSKLCNIVTADRSDSTHCSIMKAEFDAS